MSEEKKYKINVNRPEPDSADIKKFEDFNSVVSKHRDITKRPVYKQKRTYFTILLIIIVIYVVYLSTKETAKEEKGLPQTEQTQNKSDR